MEKLFFNWKVSPFSTKTRRIEPEFKYATLNFFSLDT